MSSRIDYSRLRHAGRPTESAIPRRKAWNDNEKAKAANTGRSFSADERARWAAANGYAA